MAKMVTREFAYQKVTVLVYDKTSKSNVEMEVTIPEGEYTSRRLENTLYKVIDGNIYRIIDVLKAESYKELRGMKQEEFLAHSVVLPPRNKNNEED